MHDAAPSIVAVEGAELAGYALAMPVEAAPVVPILAPLFERLRTLAHGGRSPATIPHDVMGQIGLHARQRGRGAVDAMYREHRAQHAGRDALVVTAISTRNTRVRCACTERGRLHDGSEKTVGRSRAPTQWGRSSDGTGATARLKRAARRSACCVGS